jgi:phage terminase small subunit
VKRPPRPPSGLSPAARAWWKRLQAEYALSDEGGLALLEQAARAYHRLEQARVLLDRDGPVIVDRFNQKRQHPAASVERDARSGLLAALRALRLDVGPEADEVR